MVNFILNETNIEKRSYLELIIINFIGIREEEFKIHKLEEYTPKGNNEDIYIITKDNIDEALLIAEKIRKTDNWNSKIIIITDLKKVKTEKLLNNLLILNYIDNKDNIKDKLKESFFIAYKLFNQEKEITINSNGEIKNLQYNSILYIEKCNNQNYCTVHTINNKYLINNTIKKLEEELDPTYFFKTHRSCIVNIFNIKKYNYSKNIITFKQNNKKTDLIARDKRKILKDKLIKDKIEQ